ncbi:MAG: LicD family protein [Bacilli bacterium]|nr:LicD family protein [Bacilli bacterium]
MNKLRQLQLVELEMLKEIIKICNENNIRYYLMGGTLLGAVRHKGFIPWDDDIDIGMKRQDYEKFLSIADQYLSDDLKIDYFKEHKGEKDYISNYVAKVENKKVKVKNKTAKIERMQNAWIDIFPLDGMPRNFIIRKFHMLKLLYSRLLLKYSQFSTITNQRIKGRPLHEKILMIIGKICQFEKLLNNHSCLEKIDKNLKKYQYDDSDYVVNFMGAYKFKEMFPRQIYEEIGKYSFEGLELTGPKNYDLVLTQLYGDYMKEPKDKNHHFTEL